MYKAVLKKYWGYPDFRPMQEDIIRSVAEDGKDTLGLLPTGGGKSIIFQVPALAKDGVCLVVSPLIALMKDQVENLKRQNIAAAAIYSGMTKDEILITLENAAKGKLKFVYLSPERLGTELFLKKLPEINVNLLAIDEAHCISQWGYDFRPSYLKIAEVRKFLPNIPILALTATATPVVVDDIQEKLEFKEKNPFKKSFERKNVVYIVRKTNDKFGQLLKLTQNIGGTGVVYVRSRKLTEKVAAFLKSHNISADFYHAGLTPKEKDKKQDNWKNNITRIIVSTNAFGMGIDKPDVRFVIHIDLADSLEAYFQEAGRGGRDLKDAYAFLLFNDEDVSNLQNSVQKSFPEKHVIFSVYEALCNYFQIPVGSGKEQTFDFVLSKFAQTFDFNALEVYNSLRFLQKEGYLEYTEEIFIKSRVHFKMDREELYKFQVEHPRFDAFIKFLLRSYPGLFSNYINIDEYWIARSAKTEPKFIYAFLDKLAEHNVIDYLPQKITPYITFLQERIHPKSFTISEKNYDFLKENYIKRIDAVVNYVQNTNKCRSQILLEYFGEFGAPECGRCDYCHAKKALQDDNSNYLNDIVNLLKINELTVKQICEKLSLDEQIVKNIIKKLIDNKQIIVTSNRTLKINL
ncbi:MAG: RecQ family ATP-dependent DNA helicase [Bacteroidales bacterium]|nr:RecQ family ATP-dependent DNA helicase [Bacteroidales bacterium]